MIINHAFFMIAHGSNYNFMELQFLGEIDGNVKVVTMHTACGVISRHSVKVFKLPIDTHNKPPSLIIFILYQKTFTSTFFLSIG